MVDRDRISKAVEEIIAGIGDDPTREGLAGTPARIAEMYAEIFAGLKEDPRELLEVAFEKEEHEEMVVLKDIPFYSMCEHHFLPFHGLAHVGYIPRRRLVGISKLARVVETLARRPQLQERLTGQIADTIMEGLGARGVAVVIEAEHLCMTMRGIRKPGSRLVTSANRGIFRTQAATRAEFFSILGMAQSGGR
ncbi:MAG TPA: GTP cyclohydrolase I FolE [Anaerolineae bacterium]|nr:GTP cyclohydrolase I FolE [Anaerolineae bacterium]